MKYLATIFFLLATLITTAQPNKNKVDSVLLNGDTLYQFINGVKSVRGVVVQISSSQAINYLSGGNYIGITSGNAVKNFGSWNIAIGDNALDSANDAVGNTLFNKDAGQSIRDARHNFAVGWDALQYLKSGDHNVAILEDALHFARSARDNVAIGKGAQYSHQTPVNNVNIGYNTSYYQEVGTENTAVGAYALGFIKRGYNNTAVGAYAGEVNDTSKTVNNSTFIGWSAGISSPYSNVLCVGYRTDVTGDFQMNIAKTIYGENIGLPNAKIKIKGSLEVTTGDITFNGVHYLLPATYPIGVQSQLVNDGNGNLSWQPITQPTAQKINYTEPETFAAYTTTGQLLYLVKTRSQ